MFQQRLLPRRCSHGNVAVTMRYRHGDLLQQIAVAVDGSQLPAVSWREPELATDTAYVGVERARARQRFGTHTASRICSRESSRPILDRNSTERSKSFAVRWIGRASRHALRVWQSSLNPARSITSSWTDSDSRRRVNGLEAREQLQAADRLDHIVIGALFKRGYDVNFTAAGADEDDWNRRLKDACGHA